MKKPAKKPRRVLLGIGDTILKNNFGSYAVIFGRGNETWDVVDTGKRVKLYAEVLE